MADVLADGLAWLDGQRSAHMTRPVVYRRGPRSVTIMATAGRTQFEAESAPDIGVVQQTESRDYLITTSALDLGEGPTEPLRGDLIEDTDAGGKRQVYEVMPFGIVGDTHWRYCDPLGVGMRIHTKKVDTL